MNNIGIDQSLCTKCDYQQNLKDVLDAAMVSTPEGVTDNSLNMPLTSTLFKKPSASKSVCSFTNIFNVKPKTEKRCIVTVKSKYRSMKLGNSQWTKK